MKSFPLPRSWIVLRKLQELRRNARLTRAGLEELQLRKFRRLVTHVSRHSPYYQDIIRERGIDIATCVPGDFPVLRKSVLMENFDRIVTDRRITRQAVADFLARSTDPRELFLGQYHVVQTSGSSGEAGYVVFSRSDWLRGLTQGLRLQPLNRLFARRRYAFYGAAGGHYAAVSGVSAGIHATIIKRSDIRVYEINNPLAATVDRLNAFQPEGLGGYTTSLRMLAEKQRQGALRLSPRWIEVMGEAVTEADRMCLQSAFGCGVFNLYGCSEHSLMGIGLPEQSGMTLHDDDLIYEFHEDHIIVTNLFNATLPLIRYRTDDIIRLRPAQPASSPYRQIENLVGRAEISAAFRNRKGDEDFINLPMLIYTIPHIRRFQMQPIDESNFNFLICPETQLTPRQQAETIANVKQWLQKILDQKMMGNVRFEVILVPDIAVDTKTRKFRAVAAPGPLPSHAAGSEARSA